jgi:hypothetical protein
VSAQLRPPRARAISVEDRAIVSSLRVQVVHAKKTIAQDPAARRFK